MRSGCRGRGEAYAPNRLVNDMYGYFGRNAIVKIVLVAKYAILSTLMIVYKLRAMFVRTICELLRRIMVCRRKQFNFVMVIAALKVHA